MINISLHISAKIFPKSCDCCRFSVKVGKKLIQTKRKKKIDKTYISLQYNTVYVLLMRNITLSQTILVNTVWTT